MNFNADALPADLRRDLDALWPLWSKLELPPGSLGVVLGSGLGSAADGFPVIWEKDFGELGLPETTVVGHHGRLLLAEGPGAPFLFLQGRLHRYEGLPDRRLLLPYMAMARLGPRGILITNAAGGLDPSFRAGEFMLIRDILSFQLGDPLRGAASRGEGRGSPRDVLPRPLFAAGLAAAMEAAAEDAAVKVHGGVLAVWPGPAYETRAEIDLARKLGAQAASMSTFPESAALARLGLPLLGLSCITNEIKEIAGDPLHHEEVVSMGQQAAGDFARLLGAWSARMGGAGA